MNKNHEDHMGWIFPAAVFGGVFVAWLLNLIFLHDAQDRGTFGDMFGAVNSLFSGLAFGGVIYAILLQRKELQLQRTELQLTRNELQGQKEQMKDQNVTLKKQNFESTFFQLLRLHNDITNSIDLIGSGNQITSGRDCFKVFYERFTKLWDRNSPKNQGATEQERINKTYMTFYRSHQAEFGHYFRSLYNIVKLIDNTELEDKRIYTNLVRAQLSSYELNLLFYNALSDLGREKFKPLIERYSLLKNLPRTDLANEKEHVTLYRPEAFGDQGA